MTSMQPEFSCAGLFPHTITIRGGAGQAAEAFLRKAGISYEVDGPDLHLHPGAFGSWVPFLVRHVPEAGLHGWLRVVPLLGLAMANTALPPEYVERLGAIVAALARALEDGRLEAHEVAQILGAALASDRVARVLAAAAEALADGRLNGADVLRILQAAA